MERSKRGRQEQVVGSKAMRKRLGLVHLSLAHIVLDSAQISPPTLSLFLSFLFFSSHSLSLSLSIFLEFHYAVAITHFVPFPVETLASFSSCSCYCYYIVLIADVLILLVNRVPVNFFTRMKNPSEGKNNHPKEICETNCKYLPKRKKLNLCSNEVILTIR